MNSPPGNQRTESRELNSSNAIINRNYGNGNLESINGEVEANNRLLLVKWLTSLLPTLNFSRSVTDSELRACLSNGTVLCQILNKLKPASVTVVSETDHSLPSQSENVKSFLRALDGMGLPRFEISDLEKGSMKAVVDCLLTLRTKSLQHALGDNSNFSSPRSVSSPELSSLLRHHVGHKFHEVFQLKPGSYADLPADKIAEIIKSNCLDCLLMQNAPTQSLLNVVNGILEESMEKRSGEIPHRVACLLRKISQEIERRIATQAEHIRTQNNLFKAREEKYQSRIRVLETLASRTSEETEIFASPPRQWKDEKIKEEENEEDEEEVLRLMKELEDKNFEISALKEELGTTKNTCKVHCSQMGEETKAAKTELRQKTQDYEHQIEELRHKVKELEASSESKHQKWNMKKNQLQAAVNFHFSSLQKLRLSWESIKQDIVKEQTVRAEECNHLGVNIKPLVQAAENYQVVLAENRKLFNEIQELKGNIRVYCRIRPFLSEKKEKQSIVEHVGENHLIVVNPSKEGKDAHRSFKFNKVFGPASTQVDVYSDIQSYVRSVLDGYNVCIFAYGQTGSGKTYTMTGPSGATSESLGVNYRALNDLFTLSTSRARIMEYEIGVQMVEIYNEQVRDLLLSDGSSKRLGILTQSQTKGLAVPDANLYPVKAPSDVIKLMEIGLNNRAIGATAMNERSSRSHSVVSIHVQGKDLTSGSTLHGNLHLVDLAGSERVDRSEVIGGRLREAQHINKSLSALGDVIFSLSQKSSHIPYRNSKLTQLLHTSLGGHAKTLMFVQINSDVSSFSETLSTLKFAERAAGVELGAARSNKEGRDVKELIEQVGSMKNAMSKKDNEIERLQLQNATVGGIHKQSQKPSSGNHKHLEAETQQPMDDRMYQNESHNQFEIGRDKAKKTETWRFPDAGIHATLSDISDSGVSQGAESDGSSENYTLTESTKSSDNTEKHKAVPKNIPVPRKLGRTPSAASIVRDFLKKPTASLRKSTSIGNLKPPKRWT